VSAVNYSVNYEEQNPIDFIVIFFILTSIVGTILTIIAVEHANPQQTEKAFITLYIILTLQLALYLVTKWMNMRKDIIIILDTMMVIFLFLFKMKRTRHLRK